MNQEPTNEQRGPQLSDEELVNDEIARARAEQRPLSHAAARVAASMLHNGMSSPLYALASSGALLDGLSDELDRELRLATEHDAPEIAAWVEQLQAYVTSRDSNDPVDGWSELWLEQPVYVDTGLDENDECTECGEHFANPHDPRCNRSHEDYEVEEDDSYSSVPAEADALTRLEAEIQAKLGHVSTAALVRRMERAPDFGYDDEQIELSRRLREQGKTWRWTQDFHNPRIVVEGTDTEVGDAN